MPAAHVQYLMIRLNAKVENTGLIRVVATCILLCLIKIIGKGQKRHGLRRKQRNRLINGIHNLDQLVVLGKNFDAGAGLHRCVKMEFFRQPTGKQRHENLVDCFKKDVSCRFTPSSSFSYKTAGHFL